MPIRVQNDLPVKEILEKENIFVMDEFRATHQDIRPIRIGLLNLMPLKEDTELQLLRSLSNTPLQVDIVFVTVKSHESKNTSANHLNRFYETFDKVKNQKFDGFIITGAPVEQMPFELFMPVYDKLLNFSTSKLKLGAKIVQGESRAKEKPKDFHFALPSRSQSWRSKDSARRMQYKRKAEGFAFALLSRSQSWRSKST